MKNFRKIKKSLRKTAGIFLFVSSDFKNHSEKGRKEFWAVHNNNLHKNTSVSENILKIRQQQEKEASAKEKAEEIL